MSTEIKKFRHVLLHYFYVQAAAYTIKAELISASNLITPIYVYLLNGASLNCHVKRTHERALRLFINGNIDFFCQDKYIFN